MAQDVTFDLGSFSLSSYLDENFVLTVSTSILMSVPVQHPGICTATNLRDQVQAGLLWVTRAGSCLIELSIDFEDSLESDTRKSLQCMVVEAFEIFPVSYPFPPLQRRTDNMLMRASCGMHLASTCDVNTISSTNIEALGPFTPIRCNTIRKTPV